MLQLWQKFINSSVGRWAKENWQLAAMIAGGLLLLVLLFLLIRWLVRRKKGAGDKPALTKGRLVYLWKHFIGQIPSKVRAAVERYPVFLVMGDASSGKSQMIAGCTQWKGQARQFLPSETGDPLLQIYLGGHELVVEQSAMLLEDVSKTARVALWRLWKRVFRNREPRVVLTLKASDLAQSSPDEDKRLAQTFRGKLNLLSELRGKPVSVSIALTHMDHFDGFPELAEFLKSQGVPLTLDPNIEGDQGHHLDEVEPYLPNMLTHIDTEGFKRVLGMLHNSPKLFEDLKRFITVLSEPQPLSKSPVVERIFLTSASIEPGVSHPFQAEAAPPPEPKKLRRRLMVHRLIAAAIAVLGVAALLFGFFSEYMLRNRAVQAMTELEQGGDLMQADKAEARIEAFEKREVDSPVLDWLPGFYEHEEQALRDRFQQISTGLRERKVEKLRNQHLLPALQRCVRSDRPQEKTLFCLALIYASKDNKLGPLVLADVDAWSEAIEVSTPVIRDYVVYSDKTYDGEVALGELPASFVKGYQSTELPWLVFFSELTRTLGQASITDSRLQELRELTLPMLAAIDDLKQFSQIENIYALLEEETDVNLRRIFGALLERLKIPDWINQNQKKLEAMLLIVREQELRTEEVKTLTFQRFVTALKVMMGEERVAQQVYYLTLADTDFSFDVRVWKNLIWRSRVKKFIQSYIDEKKRAKHAMFFRERNVYPDIVLNRYNDGSYLFTGKARVEGWYTRQAFDNEIKPCIAEFDSLSVTLPIGEDERQTLQKFVNSAMDSYADSYRRQMLNFYQAFGVEANSVGALLIAMRELLLVDHPLREFLETIRDNCALEYPPSGYFHTLGRALAEFQFIGKLLEEEASAAELLKYQDILQRIVNQLEEIDDGIGPQPNSVPIDQAEDLYATMDPEGRLAYDILTANDASMLKICKAWLKSVGITEGWQRPFLSPIEQLSILGRGEIEDKVAWLWEMRIVPQLAPLLGRYPFKPSADVLVSYEDLESVLLPQGGSFWQDFDSYLKPVTLFKDGAYRTRFVGSTRVRLPDNMLSISSQLKKLSAILWDDDFAPRPLAIEVKPRLLPAPPAADGKAAVVLSFLTSGDNKVFGFNQTPEWQTLSVEWWNSLPSSVGIQLRDPDEGENFTRNIPVPETMWSFFRLLDQGRRKGSSNAWGFYIRAVSERETGSDIEFELKEDPWRIFQVDTP